MVKFMANLSPETIDFYDRICAYGDWSHTYDKQKRQSLYKELKEKTRRRIRNRVITKYFKVLFHELIYNKVVFAFPGGKVFLFIAQTPAGGSKRWFFYSTGMYRVKLFTYYKGGSPKGSKIIIMRRVLEKMLWKAIKDGHRYDTYENIIKEL